VLAYQCEDPVRVVVTDPASGNPVCDATVTASHDGSPVSAVPCFSFALGEGTWTIRAEKDGYQPVGSVVTVNHDAGCEPVLHRVELTLVPLGGAPALVHVKPRPAPVGPAPVAPIPAAPAPSSPAPAGPPPAAPTAAPSASQPPADAPPPSATFPDVPDG
jgi:hypothetical protein